MRIGVPREIKNNENRVGLVPSAVRELTAHGHEVLVEAGAALGIGIKDATYVAAGASIVSDAAAVFAEADMVVKVKEPLPVEIARFGFLSTIERLRGLGLGGRLRQPGAQPYVTDNGNYIFDAQLPESFDPATLERQIKGTLGVVETGFFLGMANVAFVAAPEGVREVLG